MFILTMEYKYRVFQRLLRTNESFDTICSKSGLSIIQARQFLKINHSTDV